MATEVETKQWLAIEAFSAAHEEPKWFQELRQNMLQKSATLPLPRYEKIDYRRWGLENLVAPTTTPATPDLAAQAGIDQQADNTLIQAGATTFKASLSPELAAQGVIFTDLWTALKEHSDLVQKYFMQQAVKPDANRLTALHTAFINGGAFLYVPANVQVKEALTAHYLQDSTQVQNMVHHVLIVAEANSDVAYLENWHTVGTETNVANVMVEVVAGDNARVRFSAVDALAGQTKAYFSRQATLGQDARVDWAIGFMNDGDVVGDFNTDLRGKGSHSEVKVVAVSTDDQQQGVNTRVTNYGEHTIGHILQHGVILETSALTFNGIGHIVKGARGSDSQQENRVLMLSTHARGNADPILLIDENDVTAGHAASVGRVDEEQMYYLMSRGISKKVAERLVIRGFLGSVITEIPAKAIREQLTATIERKLENGQRSE
jgi:Fe-S cluster assembly protein SufD